MDIKLGAIIAERRLRVTGQPELDVRVRIGMPQPFSNDSRNYYCPYQISGLGNKKVKYAGGVDALQALELAICILPAELNVLRRHCPALGWLDAPDGDFGSLEVAAFGQNAQIRKDDS